MSQENVALARAFYDGIARATQEGLDPEATVAEMCTFWDPDMEHDLSESPVFDIGGVYRGITASSEFWREWFAAWEALEFDYSLVGAGECVVMLLDLRMRGRSTGIEMALGKHAWVTTFRDGLMVHSKLYMSQSEALKAVGLEE